MKYFIISLFIINCLHLNAQIENAATSGLFSVTVDVSGPHGFGVDNSVDNLREVLQEQCSGSAFLIRVKGEPYLVTCAHVVESASDQKGDMLATDMSGKNHKMGFVGGDTFLDIAVLEFMDYVPDGVAKRKDYQFKIGVILNEKVKAWGAGSLDAPAFVKRGWIAGECHDFQKDIGGYGFLALDFEVFHGMSGGPLVDEQGLVAGVVCQRTEQGNKGMPISYALSSQVAWSAVQKIIANREGQRIKRAFTGMVFKQVSGKGAELNPPVIFDGAIEGSPAYSILREWQGATIKKINNLEINKLCQVYEALEPVAKGQSVTILLEKKGVQKKISIQTEELNKEKLEKIADYHFWVYADHSLLGGENKCVIKKLGQVKETEIRLAGLKTQGKQVMYVVNEKSDLGVLVRLCSDMGEMAVSSMAPDQGLVIVRNQREKETMKGIINKIIYY